MIALAAALIAGSCSAGAGASDATITSDELAAIMAEGDANTFLIDVRRAEEYAAGAIPGAINIPYDVISGNLPTDDRSARIIVYCASGRRSAIARATLVDLGFTNVTDFGGVTNWTGELVSTE